MTSIRQNKFGIGVTRLGFACGVIASIILLSLFWMAGAEIPSEARMLAPLFIGLSAAVLVARGASDLSPATWIVILAAYPILIPFVTVDLLGFPAFATGSRFHQTPQAVTVPALIGGLACLFLSLALTVARVSLPPRHRLVDRRVAMSSHASLALFMGACFCFCVANLVDAPFSSLQLGQVSYRELKETRDDNLNAASGLLIAFGAMSAMALIVIQGAPNLASGVKRACTILFVCLTFFVVTWQILAASRIEVVGLLLLLYLLFGHKLRPALRFASVCLCVGALGAVGYFRTLVGLLAYLSRDFISWPGGAENVFNTYTFGLTAVRDGVVDIQLGQSYLNILERLPPQALGLDRPERAYELVSTQTHLIGGEYFLFEPFLNFLGFGVALALFVLAWGINSAVRSLNRFYSDGVNFAAALLSLVMFTICFRMIWYGLEHTIKVLIIAVILATPFVLLGGARPSRRSRSAHVYRYQSPQGS